jgi:AraC-like DNA-binding protein
MNSIPTLGICAFVIDPNSPDEVSIHPLDNPNEQIFIRRFAPYDNQYALIAKPHRHTFYQIMLFLNGEGNCTVDFVQFDVQQGMVLFMVPGQVHNYYLNDKTNFYVVDFSEGYFQSFLHDAHYYERFPFFLGNLNESAVILPVDLLKKVTVLFDNMIKEGRHNSNVSNDLVKVWMLEVLLLIAALRRDSQTKSLAPKSSSMISKFKKLVDENFVKLSLPKDYAALLFVTPSYLNQMTHRILSKTAGEVIRDRKLLEAKRMLVNLDLNISQIAYDLNYTDASHFSKFFKKYTGRSPEDFRKKAFEDIE